MLMATKRYEQDDDVGEPTNRQGRIGAVSAIWEGTTVPGKGQGSPTFPQSSGFDGTCGSEKAGNTSFVFLS